MHYFEITFSCNLLFKFQIHQKNETVRKLKSNISFIEHDSEVSNRKLVTEAQKVEIAEIKNSDGKKAKLQQEVIQLKQRLQTQVSSHKDSELTLRKVRIM